MRIASITNTALDSALGSGKTVVSWSNGLGRLGHEVDVYAPADFYRPWPQEKGKRLKMRLDALRLRRIILAGQYDLVEFYGAEFGLLIKSLSQLPRSRRPFLVAHTNGLELLGFPICERVAGPDRRSFVKRLPSRTLRSWMDRIDLWAFEKVDAFAAICDMDVDYIIDRKIQSEEQCVAVEPGLDEVFLGAKWDQEKAHRIVYLGNWTARKDPWTLMTAVNEVMTVDSSVEFHVMGAWEAEQLVREALHPSLHCRTVVHPRLEQADMVRVLSEAKVLLFPSRYEGFGMAIAEAMACGCAVVVTPTGFGASIRHEIDGMSCPFGQPMALAAGALRLLRDESFRSHVAGRGRARVSGLSWARQVEALDAVYRRWIERSGADAPKAELRNKSVTESSSGATPHNL